MIFQLSIEGYEWILGLGIMFALALLLTSFTNKDLKTFFAFLTMFNAFVVWAGLLELWTLILNVIVLSIIVLFEYKQKGAEK